MDQPTSEANVGLSIAYSLRRIADSLERIERQGIRPHHEAREQMRDLESAVRTLWLRMPLQDDESDDEAAA